MHLAVRTYVRRVPIVILQREMTAVNNNQTNFEKPTLILALLVLGFVDAEDERTLSSGMPEAGDGLVCSTIQQLAI